MSSYDVRIWNITVYKGKIRSTYTVRWRVAHARYRNTFSTRALAESFRAKLITAAREGEPFDEASGLPESMARRINGVTWYEHAREFATMKWPAASPRHRKSIAEALAGITMSLFRTHWGAVPLPELRAALRTTAFNKAAQGRNQSPETTRALEWAAAASRRIVALEDLSLVRAVLEQLATRLDGQPAAPNTIRRKHAIFYGALRYAVERRLLASNPLDALSWRPPPALEIVDRRVVVNPTQARELLIAVSDAGGLGPRLVAFFGCLYYAALRPSEAAALTRDALILPRRGWGELHVGETLQYVGREWTDHGRREDTRGLKHRPRNETRVVPAPPQLVAHLRRHLDTFPNNRGRRIFVGPRGGAISADARTRAWNRARAQAFNSRQQRSPLARRPYDLRHAAVSTWLNAGVPATQVAEWAGHSVAVLLKVYAKCIDGQQATAQQRIDRALDEET